MSVSLNLPDGHEGILLMNIDATISELSREVEEVTGLKVRLSHERIREGAAGTEKMDDIFPASIYPRIDVDATESEIPDFKDKRTIFVHVTYSDPAAAHLAISVHLGHRPALTMRVHLNTTAGEIRRYAQERFSCGRIELRLPGERHPLSDSDVIHAVFPASKFPRVTQQSETGLVTAILYAIEEDPSP